MQLLNLEKAKQEKIYEIKMVGIMAVFEDASSQIKDFLNFEIKFLKPKFLLNRIFAEFCWKKNYLKKNKDDFLISLEIPIDKNEFSDVFEFFENLSKIAADIKTDKKFYDFIFSSSLQKYTVFSSRLIKKYCSHKKQKIKNVNEIDFYYKCAILGETFLHCNSGNVSVVLEKFEIARELEFTDLILPPNITKISYRAFSGCEQMKKIEIGENVKIIEDLAFEDCKKLKSVILSDKIEYIGKKAFANCNIENLSHKLLIIENGLFYNEDKTQLICITNQRKELFLPLSVKKIDDIYYSAVKKISLSENCECYCHILPYEKCEVELRNDNEEIVANFISTTSIDENDVKKWKRKNPLKSVSEMELLKYNWIERIHYGAFANCLDLTEIKLKNRIDFIDELAFENCTNLSKVEIENPNCEVASNAFHNTNILNFKFKSQLDNTKVHRYEDDIKIENGFFFSEDGKTLIDVVIPQENLVIPEGVTEIGFKACSNSKILKTVTLPSTLETISSHAFSGCPKLNNVKILNSCHISYGAFSECKTLSNIELPEELTYEQFDFLNETSVINLNHNLFTIEDGIVYSKDKKKILGYTKVPENLVIQEGVKSIERRAFEDCDIKSVTFPLSVKNIDTNAFEDCKNLSKIEAKNDKIKIDANAFINCAIEDFNSEKIGENFFVIKNGLAILKVGKEIVPLDVTNYKLKDSRTIEVPSGVTKISIEVFDSCFCRLLKVPLSVRKIEFIENFTDIRIDKVVVEYEGSEEDWKKIKYTRDIPNFKKVKFFQIL